MDVIKSLQMELEEAMKKKEEARIGLSEADIKRSDIEHDIETRKMNAFEGYKLCKELQEVLQERRAWKTVIHNLNKDIYNIRNQIKRIEKKRLQKINRVVKKDGWFKHFDDKALAIMNGQYDPNKHKIAVY